MTQRKLVVLILALSFLFIVPLSNLIYAGSLVGSGKFTAEVDESKIFLDSYRNPDLPIVIYDSAVLKFGELKNKVLRVGQKISIDLLVDPRGQNINLIDCGLRYSTSTLKFLSRTNTKSAFAIHVNQIARTGEVLVSALQPYPGLKQESNITSLLFEVIGVGPIELVVLADPLVLASDGFGSNVFREAKTCRLRSIK